MNDIQTFIDFIDEKIVKNGFVLTQPFDLKYWCESSDKSYWYGVYCNDLVGYTIIKFFVNTAKLRLTSKIYLNATAKINIDTTEINKIDTVISVEDPEFNEKLDEFLSKKV